MPSLVQEMQEMQDFAQLQKVKMKLLKNVA